MKSLGQIAYEAYGDNRQWLTVGGAAMPTWEMQKPEISAAWEAAAFAVVNVDRSPAPEPILSRDDDRCAWCGWRLAAATKYGCVRGNCSHRPLPTNLYDAARAATESKVKPCN